MDKLANYRQLIARVDELCSRIERRFAAAIACRPGCDRCCRHLSLFPVEAYALARAAADLSPESRSRLLLRAAAGADLPCPLLEEGRCLLYTARPIICRTHGLPLLLSDGGSSRIDFCPDNFQGLETLPGEAVIRLDTLNEALAAVNAHFLASSASLLPADKERLTIGEALLLSVPTPEAPEEQ